MKKDTDGLIKLHLGCGKRFFPGWIHVDINKQYQHVDYISNIDELNFAENNSIDLIYSSHAFEYLDREEACSVLKEWQRALKPGGLLRLAVPDFAALLKIYQCTGNLKHILGPLYGCMKISTPSGEKNIYHKTTYDEFSLQKLLEENGFQNIRHYRWQDTPPHDTIDDHSQAYFPHMDKEKGLLVSLNMEARKAL